MIATDENAVGPPRQRLIETVRFPVPMSYETVYAMQLERRKAVERGEAGNALFIVEHTPVITLGRNFQSSSLLHARERYAQLGVELCEVDRGGDATYHGPGQLVAYPVLDLNQWAPSIKWYLRTLEEVIIGVLARYGLNGERLEGYTGVWVGGAKVAAIGIGLHSWVTFHGIAINVTPNMDHFGLIIPCGIADKPVTSLRQLLNTPPSMEQVAGDFVDQFATTFACSMATT